MDLCEEVSEFDKGQIVMARQMGVSISETAKLVGCSRAAVVNTYRQWCEKGPEETGERVPYGVLNTRESCLREGREHENTSAAAAAVDSPHAEEENGGEGGADTEEEKAPECTVGKEEPGDEVLEQ